MELPKYNKNRFKRIVLKICKEPGCGREFLSHPIGKYCPLHRDISCRKRKRRVYGKPEDDNMVFHHKYDTTVKTYFKCRTCGVDYPVTIYPHQYVYPAHCPAHVNPFKRKQALAEKLIK